MATDRRAEPSSDEEWQRLIDGLSRGDEAVLREFHAKYGPMLHGIAESRLAPSMRSRFDADDVVQSTFRTFFRRARIGYFQFEDNQRLWNLMCAITLTKLREKARYHGRKSRSVKREQSSDSTLARDQRSIASEVESPQPSPDASVAFADAFETLLQSLDETEQKLVDLKLQDLTNDEVAEALNVSERTVRRMLNRLQEKIEQGLADTR